MSINQKSIEVLLEEFSTAQRRKRMAESTLRQYLYEAKGFFHWLELHGISGLPRITRETVRQYQADIYRAKTSEGKPYSVSYQTSKIHAVKTFLQTMCDEGRILFNPAEDIEFPRMEYRLPKNILSEKEYARLIRSIRGRSPEAVRDRLIFELLYMTGIRKAELAGIKLEDIDYEHSTLRIEKGKGNKIRFIPILPRTTGMIRRYTEEIRPVLLRGKTSDALFINNSATAIRPGMTLNVYLKRYQKEAGIRKKITVHSFRHTFATALLKNGAPIRHIQRLLGHDKIRTTTIYTHLSIEDLKKAHQRFHPFENGAAMEVLP